MPSDAPPLIFDRELLTRRRARAAAAAGFRDGDAAGSRPDFLLTRASEELLERLALIKRTFATLVVLGVHDAALGNALRASGRHDLVVEMDPVRTLLAGRSRPVVQADEECLPLRPGAVDAVLAPLTLQYANDLPGVLHQIKGALRPDGVLLAALVGGESLTELRQAFVMAESELEGGASPRVAPFVDARDLGGLLQRAGFALPVVDSDRFTVAYSTPLALLQDLRAMGASNVLVERRRTPLRRATLLRAMELYAERFSRPDGKVLATFEIVTATAWAPHESQQKPLAPGSAKARLADALGTRERPAGERTGR